MFHSGFNSVLIFLKYDIGKPHTVLSRYLGCAYYAMVKQICCRFFLLITCCLYHHFIISISGNNGVCTYERALRILVLRKIECAAPVRIERIKLSECAVIYICFSTFYCYAIMQCIGELAIFIIKFELSAVRAYP